MAFTFKKATKAQAKLRLALHGPSGAGKTFSGLSIASHLVEPGQRVALLDTERGSASKYADKFDFDVVEVSDNYHPKKCIDTISAAGEGGYGAIVIDSGTHFWNGLGGFLALVDAEAKLAASKVGRYDSFGAWKAVDPIYQQLVLAITSAPLHVIMTLRAKQAYEKVEDERGKSKIQKLGMAPQMRDDFQYEFDIEGMLNLDHDLVIGKTRCEALDGRVFNKPGREFADLVKQWLGAGTPYVDKQKPAPRSVAFEPQREVQAANVNETTEDLGPVTGPNSMFIAIGVSIEKAGSNAEIDACMTEARQAYAAKLLTADEGKRLGALGEKRKRQIQEEIAAAFAGNAA